MHGLETLDVSQNTPCVQGESAAACLTNPKMLHMKDCTLSPGFLPSLLGNLVGLSELDISEVNLNREDVCAIAELKSLERLDMGYLEPGLAPLSRNPYP